jgi:hypothetical protein
MIDPSDPFQRQNGGNKKWPHGWPAWKRRDSAWLFTTLGAVALVVFFAYPSLAQHGWRQRIGILLMLFAVTFALSILIFAIECGARAVEKALAFDGVFAQIVRIAQERDRARGAVRQYASMGTPYEVDRVILHDSKYYVALRKKPGPALPDGTIFVVMDITDGSIMGRFRVTETKKLAYLAIAVGDIDALWAGYIHSKNSVECSPPPNTAAFVFPEQEAAK